MLLLTSVFAFVVSQIVYGAICVSDVQSATASPRRVHAPPYFRGQCPVGFVDVAVTISPGETTSEHLSHSCPSVTVVPTEVI